MRSIFLDRRTSVDRQAGALSVAALLVLACSLLLASPGAGTEAGGESPLFGPPDPLVLRLEAPWSDLERRPEAGRSRDGRLVYLLATGEEIGLDVRVRTRGKSRLELCSFPMATLELQSEEIIGTLFEGQPIVHLTKQCQSTPSYRQYLVHEYLLYRAFALLTDQSLGARLISVEYVDPASKRRPKPTYAFLLEDIGLAASRCGLEWLQLKSVKPSTLDANATTLFVLFQYLIANTDWSLRLGPKGEPCCHNAAMLGPPSQLPPSQLSGLVPIPFDLDNAGLIDAEYVVPDRRLGIRSARQRLYRGFCDLNPYLESAIDRMNSARGELLALFESSEQLSPQSKKSTRKYLQSFFDIINDPALRAAKILDACR